MASTYKLTYFNGKGRAESIRLLLSHLGLNFEDVRLSPSEVLEFKKLTPLDMVPVLEIDGTLYHQSFSICRYLAKTHNLIGGSDLESLQCDIIVDATQDVLQLLWEYDNLPEDKKKQQELILRHVKVPKFLSYFEGVVKNNNGYTSGTQMTWSDIILSFFVEEVGRYLPNFTMTDYPHLVSLMNKTYSTPKIAEWLTKRPADELF